MSVSSARTPTPWGLVVLLGLLTALGPLSIDMYLPSVPALARSLNASPLEAQATLAAFLGGMALGQFFYGPASDRVGRKFPVLLGMGLYVAASAACALALTAPMLIAGRFIQALGACGGVVVARAVVRDRFDAVETARVLSLLTLVMGLAPILAPLLGGALLAVGGWRLNFWFMAAFGAALAAAAFFRMSESRSEETFRHAQSERPWQAYLALLSQPRLMGYVLAGAMNGATLFGYISASPGLLIHTYGISPQAFGWVFGLNAVGVIGGSQVNRFLLRRLTADAILLRASRIAWIAAVLLSLAAVTGFGGRWTVLSLLFLILTSYGFMQGNTMAGALNADARRSGSVSALFGGVSFAAGALTSTLTGAFNDGTPRPLALIMLGTLTGSALALRLLALRRS